jgi:hypothetical protein
MFDSLTNPTPAVQAGMLALVMSRPSVKLPEGVRIIAAANPVQERPLHRMPR